ncbi:MAG TPA: response regulator transcription factor [Gaiellales bacterium]|nr:response regulator transcription factor [Gaiellales bacterium]
MSGEPLILVVDDERPIRRALEVTLTKAGYRVATAGSSAETLTAAALSPPDLVILDLMLPDGDGAELCAELRDWLAAPILLISAVEAEGEKIRALDAGADDYLTKPFAVGELLARVRALLRRAGGAAPRDSLIEVGRLAVDLPRRSVAVDGAEIHLTPTEFDLLKELTLAAGRPLTHQMMLRKVWGPGYARETQLLRTHMGRLRDKLEAGGLARDSIETLTGVGYRLRDGAGASTSYGISR